ncbi:MAG: aspartate/glutamate racemase family protein [Thermodesulfobacteriota bacterium]
MIYRTRKGRVCSGEAIGILLLDTSVPFIPGDVANASTYDFPVRFKKVEGFTVARAIGLDSSIYPALLAAAQDLAEQGVRAVTGDCGFMALHQKRLAEDLNVPVFLSSLLQIPFILNILGQGRKVGVLTADAPSLSDNLLDSLTMPDKDRLVIAGLETQPNFYRFVIEETGELDVAAVEKEVVAAGEQLVSAHNEVAALLLECSLLPPYSQALQKSVKLPVFDYITMINFVFSAVVQKSYCGFI